MDPAAWENPTAGKIERMLHPSDIDTRRDSDFGDQRTGRVVCSGFSGVRALLTVKEHQARQCHHKHKAG